MKAESRGKYPGMKLHLDGPECKDLLNWLKLHELAGAVGVNDTQKKFPKMFTTAVVKTLRNLLLEHPNMLEDRTEAEVQAALKKDQAKIHKQLGKMAVGGDWKEVE